MKKNMALVLGFIIGFLAVPYIAFAEWDWKGELAKTEGFLGGKSSWAVEPETAETRKGDEFARQQLFRETLPSREIISSPGEKKTQPKATMIPPSKKKYTGSIEF